MNPDKLEKPSILLLLMPFWTPLMPPHGICLIKGFLQEHGYKVKTIDANLEKGFKKIYDRYFHTLKTMIPEDKRGNLYNIGNDVWREHMMAHLNRTDEDRYIELVQILVYKIFFHPVSTAQAVELKNHLVEFFALLNDYLIKLLNEEKPGLLGISVYRDTLPTSLFAFKLARELFPSIRTVMGGGIFTIQLPLGSPNFELFLEVTQPYIDKIIVGDGARILLDYLDGKLPGNKRVYTKEDIKSGAVSFYPAETFDFSDFDLKKYNYHGAQASRSCPNRCSFCNVASFYGQYMEKDPALTVREMIRMYQKYHVRLFYMLDSLLNCVIDGLSEEFIKTDYSLYFDGYFRVDSNCTQERALKWRRGGFYRARMGIESGSQKILDLMDKCITVEQIKQNIINLASAGIKTTAYIVIGHPEETEDDFMQTLALMEELRDYIWEAECNPFTYIYSGQGKSDEWSEKRILLYPEWAKEMLITQTWIVNTTPSREELYSRVARFVDFCNRLGISTPWTLKDVNKSDARWKKLHKNAVPSVLELIDKDLPIDECKRVQPVFQAKDTLNENTEFDF